MTLSSYSTRTFTLNKNLCTLTSRLWPHNGWKCTDQPQNKNEKRSKSSVQTTRKGLTIHMSVPPQLFDASSHLWVTTHQWHGKPDEEHIIHLRMKTSTDKVTSVSVYACTTLITTVKSNAVWLHTLKKPTAYIGQLLHKQQLRYFGHASHTETEKCGKKWEWHQQRELYWAGLNNSDNAHLDEYRMHRRNTIQHCGHQPFPRH